MKYCSVCGAEVRLGIPDGDNRPRHICDHCGTIHYHNPKVVAGCIAHWEDRILMCRRAIEPRLGLWTVPAGFMENGETTYEGAMRETMEEANARVDIDDLFVLFEMWGPCGAPCSGDLAMPADGIVDVADLLVLFGMWGPC